VGPVDDENTHPHWCGRFVTATGVSFRAVDVITRTVRIEDVDPLASAFADWPKPRELFKNYARRVDEGILDMVVASVESQLAGYLLIKPLSSYPPFAEAGIPEIADFNVLRSWQRTGIGTTLMDEAERRAAQISDVVGLGVGLYSDYGTAQRMYVRRGYLPDGAGVVLAGLPVQPGTEITLNDDPELMFTKRLREPQQPVQ
jgi:GNAT superfamily N-acetyltransferase